MALSNSPITPSSTRFLPPTVPSTSFDVSEAVKRREKWAPSLTGEQLAFCKNAILQLKEKIGLRMPVDREFDALMSDKSIYLQTFMKSQAARLAKNHPKNRYMNVLPFDDTRVKLDSTNGSNILGDYINASFVMDPVHEDLPVFIATQGPLNCTTIDFWQMVVQQKCPVIVMLTRLLDNNQERSAHYFPALSNQSQLFGQLRVTNKFMNYLQDQRTLQRILEVQNVKDSNAAPHMVVHLDYRDWPDFDVPSSTTAVRQMIRSLQCIPATAGPYVVHCSAGIGRTGTFCTIDHTIRRLLSGDASALDIGQTVGQFRSQRNGMVQTKEQFRFIYEAVVDELEDIVRFSQR